MIRVPQDRRREVGLKLKKKYDKGLSIRNLSAESTLAYGTVRLLLLEVGTELRSRGGRRRPKAPAATG